MTKRNDLERRITPVEGMNHFRDPKYFGTIEKIKIINHLGSNFWCAKWTCQAWSRVSKNTEGDSNDFPPPQKLYFGRGGAGGAWKGRERAIVGPWMVFNQKRRDVEGMCMAKRDV